MSIKSNNPLAYLFPSLCNKPYLAFYLCFSGGSRGKSDFRVADSNRCSDSTILFFNSRIPLGLKSSSSSKLLSLARVLVTLRVKEDPQMQVKPQGTELWGHPVQGPRDCHIGPHIKNQNR